MNIGLTISKAIKENKWLSISYVNKGGDTTHYWIAVKDVNLKNKALKVLCFNDKKSMSTYETWISFDGIKSATVVDFTSYENDIDLVSKIEKDDEISQWLNYDLFNNNILYYYNECNLLDSDPFQKEYKAVDGIDLAVLKSKHKVQLTDEQCKRIIADIYHYDLNKREGNFYTLGLNCVSIDNGKKKYVVCYYPLTFNPENKSLILGSGVRFNQSFLVEGRKYSLFNYINMNIDDFINSFSENKSEYVNLITENLKSNEKINTMPDIMLIQRDVNVNLMEFYDVIEKKHKDNELGIPLKSFFGNITKKNYLRRKEPSLIICDKKININQLRVLYNAMKYPVTYVQGPPGTGKTQTIINTVLSAFYNNKSVLVCSSNNKPVDGIVEKLQFKYRDDTILFPYLRLGKIEDVKNATLRIKELFNYYTKKVAKEELLDKIKTSDDEKNKRLIELLNIQEKRVLIEDCLESSQRLILSFGDNTSKVIETVKIKIAQLEKELAELPQITNDDILELFKPLNENYQLSQFLYFKSLQYIEKLKLPRYSELITICNILDDEQRALEFNTWCQQDANMKLLNEVFPVIFSTNISSRRLGSPNFMFDLVIIDEAGQCNVATALIPISKANSLLLVGDPNQLRPVVILEDYTNNALMQKYNVPDKYNYKTNSILDVMRANDDISKYILLKYHYRCGKKIVEFSNKRYYNELLDLSYINDIGKLTVLNVENKTLKGKNEAVDEAVEIADYIKRNSINDAFIITPFVNQKELLQSVLVNSGIEGVECGTIHSIQGAEKDTIIFSTALSTKTRNKTFDWLKNNRELINVAVTRAKKHLVIATDVEALEKMSDKTDDIYNLVQYVKNGGEIVVPPSEKAQFAIGKSNGSVAEDEFFKTISHFCTCHKTFEAERNVPVSKIMKNTELDGEYEFDFVLYEKFLLNKKPSIVFELNGGEHFGKRKREYSDRLKMEVCAKHGIKLIIIPNTLTKAYENIRDIIISAKNSKATIQQSLFDMGLDAE